MMSHLGVGPLFFFTLLERYLTVPLKHFSSLSVPSMSIYSRAWQRRCCGPCPMFWSAHGGGSLDSIRRHFEFLCPRAFQKPPTG